MGEFLLQNSGPALPGIGKSLTAGGKFFKIYKEIQNVCRFESI
jgi:hypothetical protein